MNTGQMDHGSKRTERKKRISLQKIALVEEWGSFQLLDRENMCLTKQPMACSD
jgi:hypothetical protein